MEQSFSFISVELAVVDSFLRDEPFSSLISATNSTYQEFVNQAMTQKNTSSGGTTIVFRTELTRKEEQELARRAIAEVARKLSDKFDFRSAREMLIQQMGQVSKVCEKIATIWHCLNDHVHYPDLGPIQAGRAHAATISHVSNGGFVVTL
jgi:hypothetical protein